MRVLVVNAGSSSLKLRLLDARDTIAHSADLPAGPDGVDTSGLAGILRGWGKPDAIGHRIVHGGTIFNGPALITDAVTKQLRELTDLAPLHQPAQQIEIFGMDALDPLQQRTGVMQTHTNRRMAREDLNERQIGLRVGTLNHVIKVSHRLMRVNEKDELKFRHSGPR